MPQNTAVMRPDRQVNGAWLRCCGKCKEDFVIGSPKDQYKNCPDCRPGGNSSFSERSAKIRIKDGTETMSDDDVADLRDRRDSDLLRDNPLNTGQRNYGDDE